MLQLEHERLGFCYLTGWCYLLHWSPRFRPSFASFTMTRTLHLSSLFYYNTTSIHFFSGFYFFFSLYFSSSSSLIQLTTAFLDNFAGRVHTTSLSRYWFTNLTCSSILSLLCLLAITYWHFSPGGYSVVTNIRDLISLVAALEQMLHVVHNPLAARLCLRLFPHHLLWWSRNAGCG